MLPPDPQWKQGPNTLFLALLWGTMAISGRGADGFPLIELEQIFLLQMNLSSWKLL